MLPSHRTESTSIIWNHHRSLHFICTIGSTYRTTTTACKKWSIKQPNLDLNLYFKKKKQCDAVPKSFNLMSLQRTSDFCKLSFLFDKLWGISM